MNHRNTWTTAYNGMKTVGNVIGQYAMQTVYPYTKVPSTAVGIAMNCIPTIPNFSLMYDNLANDVMTSLLFIAMWYAFATQNELVAIVGTHLMMSMVKRIGQLKLTGYSKFLVMVCSIVLTITWIMRNPLYLLWIVINLSIHNNMIKPSDYIGCKKFDTTIIQENYIQIPSDLPNIRLYEPIQFREDHVIIDEMDDWHLLNNNDINNLESWKMI